MDNAVIVARLRRFLLAMASLLLLGTLVELLLIKHWDEPLQLVPFILSAVGLAGVVWAWVKSERGPLLALRGLMIPLALGSLVGVFVHVSSNIEIYTETHANAGTLAVIAAGLGGHNPLVAPGMLALAGILAAAATYGHPALAQSSAARQSVKA